MFGGYNNPIKFPRKTIEDFLENEDNARHIKKKIKHCKYTKAEHDFELINTHFWHYTNKTFYTYKCKHCGKLKNRLD